MRAQNILALMLLVGLGTVLPAAAQAPIERTVLTAAGADCSLSGRCAITADLRGVPTFSVDLTISSGGTATVAWEVSVNGIRWDSISDDENSQPTASTDGLYYFTNPGWRHFRVRATALSGTVTVDTERGGSSIRSPIFSSQEIVDALGQTLDVNIKEVGDVAPLAAYVNTSLQSAATANGNARGYGMALLTVNCAATCSATINFEGTEDGTNYVAISQAQRLGPVNTIASSTTVEGLTYWRLPVSGYQHIRARISGYVSGTITVTGHTLLQTAATLPQMNDPCQTEVKTTTPFSITADTAVFTGAAGKKNFICAIVVIAGAAEIVSFSEGTGSACANGEAALSGTLVDTEGMSFGANSGLNRGSGGYTVIAGKTAAQDFCINVSGSNRVAGDVLWVQK